MWRSAVLMLVAASACAPTAIAPSIIRMQPTQAGKPESRFGLRSGPRPAQAVPNFRSGAFAGDASHFEPPNWSVAYDIAFAFPVNEVVAFHLGAQGELYYPVPIPAFGAFLGLSSIHHHGRLSISPAVALRGATLFGATDLFNAPSGHLLSPDVSVTFALQGDGGVRLALVPFYSLQFLPGVSPDLHHYAGALAVMKYDRVEVIFGVARYFLPDGQSFNVPMLGLRAGEN